MYKLIRSVVIEMAKEEEDKALRERGKKILEKHGISGKTWRVEGRKGGQVFWESGEFESRADFEAARDKILADKEWQDLLKERRESGVTVPGTIEDFYLTDY